MMLAILLTLAVSSLNALNISGDEVACNKLYSPSIVVSTGKKLMLFNLDNLILANSDEDLDDEESKLDMAYYYESAIDFECDPGNIDSFEILNPFARSNFLAKFAISQNKIYR